MMLVLLKLADEIAVRLLDGLLGRPLWLSALLKGSDACMTEYRVHLANATDSVTGYRPHTWQLGYAVAAHLGRDKCLITGTCFGKSLPLIMSCWIDSTLSSAYNSLVKVGYF